MSVHKSLHFKHLCMFNVRVEWSAILKDFGIL